jgi:hypothetical protein
MYAVALVVVHEQPYVETVALVLHWPSVMLQMLAAPLVCLVAATAEAGEARQLLSALRGAPPQLVVRSSSGTATAQSPAHARSVLQPTHATGQVSAPLHTAAVVVNDSASGSTQQTAPPVCIDRSASVTEAAMATSVAAFSPQLSVPLTLGLPYTNSGLLTAVCLFWVAVLWPR